MGNNSIKINLILNAAYQLLKIALPLITVPYLSRVIGSSGIGDYSFTYTVADYFVLFGLLGLNQYGNREIARVRDDRKLKSRTFCSIYATQLLFSGLVLVVYSIWAFAQNGDYRLYSLIWLWWVASDLIDVNWFFFGMEEFKITVIRNTVLKFVSLACILLFVRTEHDVWIYCLITSLNLFVSCVVLWPFLLKQVDFARPKISEIAAHIKPNFMLFIPVVAISLYTQMDKILLGIFADSSQVGLYDYSEKLSKIPLALISALSTVMLPRMSNVLARGETEKAERYLNLSFSVAVVIGCCFAFGISGVANEFVPVFFGSGWEQCATLMPILAVIIPLIAVSNVLGVQCLIPNGRDKAYTVSVVVGAIVNVLLNVLLIPLYQAYGAAIATVAAELAVLLVQLTCLSRELPLRQWTIPIICSVTSGLAMFIVLRVVGHLSGISMFTVVIEVLTGAFVYALSIIAQLKIARHPLLDSIKGIFKR